MILPWSLCFNINVFLVLLFKIYKYSLSEIRNCSKFWVLIIRNYPVFINSVSSVSCPFTELLVMITEHENSNKYIFKCDVNSGMLSSDLSQVKSGKQKSHSAQQIALLMTLKMPRSEGGGFNSIQFAHMDRKMFFYSNDKDIWSRKAVLLPSWRRTLLCLMNSVLKISLLNSLLIVWSK